MIHIGCYVLVKMGKLRRDEDLSGTEVETLHAPKQCHSISVTS